MVGHMFNRKAEEMSGWKQNSYLPDKLMVEYRKPLRIFNIQLIPSTVNQSVRSVVRR